MFSQSGDAIICAPGLWNQEMQGSQMVDQSEKPAVYSPLDDAHRRLEAVLNNASVSIVLMDHRQQCVYMNSAAELLTGYTLEEVVALDKPLHDIIHHTHPDGRSFPLAECAIDRAFPEHHQTKGQDWFIHKDGSYYPVAFTASSIRDDASKTIGTVIELRNITEEKRVEEQRQLLINEVHHRVKNTLATVQAFAWQTFKQIDLAALERFNGRLSALSQAQNILTRNVGYTAPLCEIVSAAVLPFGPDRFQIDGPNSEIPPKLAVSLAIVLHELATNAIKYGSLSVAAGRVTVRWTCKYLSEHTHLDITWEESGGPTVIRPSRRGFGSRLIERQLALQFGGTTALNFNENGLVCTMQLVVPRNTVPIALQTAPSPS